MSKQKNTTGVVVMSLTATAYKGKIREIYTSRIGFCGHYNKEILSKMGSEFKRLYAEQTEAAYREKSITPDKIVYRISTKSTECDMILNGE